MSQAIVLRQFKPAFGLPDPSPFPIKVALFMKMHGIEFDWAPGDVRQAPLKKIPYLEHKGRVIADSELILDYLSNTFNIVADDLSAEQHAAGYAVCRMLEEHAYFSIVYYRWWFDETFAYLRESLFSDIPKPVRNLIAGFIQRGVKKTLDGQGIARHSEMDVAKLLRRDYRALSNMLADRPYLFGEQMTRYDCTAIAFAAMVSTKGLPSKMPDIRSEFPNIAGYWDRAQKTWF